MRRFVISTLIATGFILTGESSFAYDELNKDALNQGIEQGRESKVDMQNASEGMQQYVVKRGDTLAEIAEKFLGSQAKWQEIAEANHLNNPNELNVGDRLLIPAASEDEKNEFNPEPKKDVSEDARDMDIQTESSAE